MSKIGLFGGTFDPVHYGHISLANRVLNEFSLDEIIFIPSGNPPHKAEKNVTEKQHRFNMVQLAVSDSPQFSVSDYELNNDRLNYSYITISHFKEENPKDEIYFIVGGDSFRDFPSWKNYRTLISLCAFIVVPRPGVAPAGYFKNFHGDEAPPRVFFLSGFSCGISSTSIRRLLADGGIIKGLVPQSVEQYIKTNNLYRSLK